MLIPSNWCHVYMYCDKGNKHLLNCKRTKLRSSESLFKVIKINRNYQNYMKTACKSGGSVCCKEESECYLFDRPNLLIKKKTSKKRNISVFTIADYLLIARNSKPCRIFTNQKEEFPGWLFIKSNNFTFTIYYIKLLEQVAAPNIKHLSILITTALPVIGHTGNLYTTKP